MTVEQTSQLIQLILNSVLLLLACLVILSGLLVRHTAIAERLRKLSQDYHDALEESTVQRGGDRPIMLRNQLLRMRSRTQTAQNSILMLYGAVLCASLSTFCLALRALIFWNGLIAASFYLFIFAVAVLLGGVGLALVDFSQSRDSLKEELLGVLNMGQPLRLVKRPRSQTQPLRSPRALPQSPYSSEVRPPQAEIG